MLINPHRQGLVTIPEEEFFSLKRSEAMLLALQSGGVDNWTWFSEAIRERDSAIKGKPWDDGAWKDYDDASPL